MTFARLLRTLTALAALAAPLWAQAAPVPLHRLGSSLRVVQITAHPGDEDGVLLLQLARQGAQTTLLTLTRGERGESRMGVLSPSAQGALRSQEQSRADELYQCAQRYTRLVDIGFVRTADEAFDRWGGHELALRDMVRVLRETRPHIVVVPFDPAAPDGDGQHQATVMLAREAVRDAADAKKFPEQLKDGVTPWQTRRLFALTHGEAYTVAIDAQERPEGSAASWLQLEQAALGELRSMSGMWHAPRTPQRRYRLLDSAPGFSLPSGAAKLQAGMDARLDALAAEVSGSDELRAALQQRLHTLAALAAQAEDAAADPAACATQLAEYLRALRAVEDRLLAVKEAAPLRVELEALRKLAEQALLQSAGVKLEAELLSQADDLEPWVLAPGGEFSVRVKLTVPEGVRVADLALRGEGPRWLSQREWQPGSATAEFRGRVPADAPFTRSPSLLENDTDGAYRVLDERVATRAVPPAPLNAVAEVEIAGEIVRAVAPVQGHDGERMQPVSVVPVLSVIVEPRAHWVSRASLFGDIEVHVRCNTPTLDKALLSVHVPLGWRVEPEHEVLEILRKGEEHSYHFYLVPEHGLQSSADVRAIVRWNSQVYDQGYVEVHSPAGLFVTDYRNSEGYLVPAAVEAAENLQIGYLGLPGDVIPRTLRDMGVRVVDLDGDALASADLHKYWAVVLGPGALDAREDLAAARSVLLAYAQAGGTIVVLQQADAARFARLAPLPYPIEIGTARVANQFGAVELLDPRDPLLQEPNELTEQDFRGWQEERARFVARRWDSHYEPLLRASDPGRPAEDGLLLHTHYGRGTVIFSALSFSRQMEGGVAGAMRLLINLLSPSAELHR